MNKDHVDVQYLNIANEILERGVHRQDRTGTGTKSIFAPRMHIDLKQGFPLLTTKRVYLEGVLHELLWFLSGDTNIKTLVDKSVNIWNADAYRQYLQCIGEKVQPITSPTPLLREEFDQKIKQDVDFADVYGDLGRVYGAQWREWKAPDGKTIDQIQTLIYHLIHNPDSRRHLVNAWNVGELDEMALPPCHYGFQMYVSNGQLSCMVNQRSADWFLGVPFNIASYATLTHMVAHVTGFEASELIMNFGDAHIYTNHIEQIREQMERHPRKLPTIELNPSVKDINDFKREDIVVKFYEPHKTIKGKVSVG